MEATVARCLSGLDPVDLGSDQEVVRDFISTFFADDQELTLEENPPVDSPLRAQNSSSNDIDEREEPSERDPTLLDDFDPDAPDNTVHELDFSLFTSPEFCYDDLADLSLALDNSDMEVVIDITDAREMEERSIARFAERGCSCKHFDGGPCCRLFSASHYQEVRDQCRELSRSELDLVVMGQLLALTNSGDMTQAKKHIPKERQRSFTYFKHGGHTICIKTFCFLHTIGQSKFKAIKASFESNGLVPRQHRHHKPRHALHLADIQYVVTFITNYAEDHAILLPGRIPGYKRDDVILLPSSTTKKAVWDLYHAAAESAPDVKAVGISSFCSLWQQLLPQIIVCKPMSDLCWTCQQNSTMIMRAHNRPEGEKSEALQRAEDHLALVTRERSSYNAALEDSKRQVRGAFTLPDGSISPPPLHCNIPAATKDITAHYSFDFAQQVHYPSNPLQPGPIYFLTPRKAALFGICCEAIPRQVNFIIDEASDTGKGANTVVSMLDYYFDHHGLGEKTVTLHADNCSGQNKNNTMMQYLMWRVMTGLHHSITISFLVVGHTKFAPDGCFGLAKREFRRTEVSSLADLEQVIQSSSVVNESQLVGTQTGEPIVPTRDWAGFLGPQFRRLTGIKRYHHFRFDKNTPGVVHLRLHSNSPEEKRRLVKDQNWNPEASDLPPTISPSGMSVERRQYLFEKIREFCREDSRDLVCPDPEHPTWSPPSLPPSPSQPSPSPPSPQRDPPQHREGPAPKRRRK